MNLLHDNYIITIDQRYENSQSKSGLIPLNTAIFADNDEQEYRRDIHHFEHKRIYGQVITCPINFTDTRYNLIDEGTPEYKGFVSHDFIQTYYNRGFQHKQSIPKYYPSTFEGYEAVTKRDLGAMTDVQPGDRVYFDYKITEPDNYLGMFRGQQMYRLDVEYLFCVIRKYKSTVDHRIKKEIIMQAGWMLVEPDMETWEEITSPAGIIMKVQPKAKALRGIVRHVRNKNRLKPGEKILYEPYADYLMKVEGKDYYCMREDEVIGYY